MYTPPQETGNGIKVSPYGGNHSTVHRARQVIHATAVICERLTFPVSGQHFPWAMNISRERSTSPVAHSQQRRAPQRSAAQQQRRSAAQRCLWRRDPEPAPGS